MDQQLFQYTEQIYASKQQIRQQFPQGVADLIWQEIIQYRQPLMRKTSLGKKEICESRLVVKSLYELECLLRVLSNYRESCVEQDESWVSNLFQAGLSESQIFYLKQVRRLTTVSWQDYIVRLQKLDPMSTIDNDCRFLSGNGTLAESILELNYLDLSLTNRLYLTYGLLIQVGLAKHLSLFSPAQLIPMLQLENQDMDQTRELLEIISRLTGQLKENMLYLQRNDFESCLRFQDQVQLQLHYPQLKQHQLQFYLENRELGCCYTLSQFRQQTKVGYETARQAMDELVTLGFYAKGKVGKKYIYQSR